MESFIKKIEVRWSDLDPNFHMLHSKYYDIGAHCRIAFLAEQGITPAFLQSHYIGPILFREECLFKKEIVFGDDITVNISLQKSTADFSRWTMIHEIWKNADTLAAIITCDGAWIDTGIRKLISPPAAIMNTFGEMPKTTDFIIYTKESIKK